MSKYIKLEDALTICQPLSNYSTAIKEVLKLLPTIEVSEDNDCMLTMFGECSYNETGCGSCAVAEKIRKALSVEVSEDCISKDWLKTELEKWSLEEGRKDAWDNWNKAIETLLEIIDDAPSATAEQSSMVGEWVEVVKRTEQYDREGVKSWAVIYQCPYCGFILNAIENHTAQYNYCPNCGAKMKGVDND